MNLFGFQIERKKLQFDPAEVAVRRVEVPTPIEKEIDDGAIVVNQNYHNTHSVDFFGSIRHESDLLLKYRQLALYPEIEAAIDDIVNESIVVEAANDTVALDLDDLEGYSAKIKKTIQEEFHNILIELDFDNTAQDMFKQFYIDGRLIYQIIINPDKAKDGIVSLTRIDALKLRKFRKPIVETKDGEEIITGYQEFYVYSEEFVNQIGKQTQMDYAQALKHRKAILIPSDSIVYVTSGLMDAKRQHVLSYLHKAIKPYNQLRMMEDALVIYRISRAPERRVFYIDVGGMAKTKAEQYMRDYANKLKTTLNYDSETGTMTDSRTQLSMLEDFWFPRSGEKTTEVQTLPGGQSLGEIQDVDYFMKKLYRALNVPYSRYVQESTGFSVGRATEITRDEVKFGKFINRLRQRFTTLFDQLLRVQLISKRIITEADWEKIRQSIQYRFNSDVYFSELKNLEIMKSRVDILNDISNYRGVYFAKKWIMSTILRFTEEEIVEMEKMMKEESGDMKENEILGTGIAGVAPMSPDQLNQNEVDTQMAQDKQEQDLELKKQSMEDQAAARKEMMKQKLNQKKAPNNA